jgi:SAM-dependent methyltransferase
MEKQVNSKHYDFARYVDMNRWMSTWHQVDEIMKLNPKSCLECGIGTGLFKSLMQHFGYSIQTADIDPDLAPDFVASVTELPMNDNSFECVCAFQVLEHLPYEKSLQAFAEMLRVSSKYVLLSLPDAKKMWTHSFNLPNNDVFVLNIPIPPIRSRVHKFNGEHYWEINKKGYALKRILQDFGQNANLLRTYRVRQFPYHRFFVFEKK